MVDRFFTERSRSGLFLDFDGTLAPIEDDPAAVQLGPRARDALRALAATFRVVAVVSGRSIDDLASRVGLPGLWLSGGHGRVIRAPDGSEQVARIDPAVEKGLARIEAVVGPLPPAIRVERKPISVAFHYRGHEQDRALIAELIARTHAAAEHLGLVATPGRCLVELRPPGIDKGATLRVIVARTGIAAVAVAGDDWTDLDAFRAARALLGCSALTVAVRGADVPAPLLAEADVILNGVDGVIDWLESLPRRSS